MVLAEFCDRACVTSVDVAEEFLGLSVKLLEIRTDGQTAVGHDEPPRTSPWSAGAGQRRFGDHVRTSTMCSGGLGPVRGREAPCTPGSNVAPSRGADKLRRVSPASCKTRRTTPPMSC